MFKKWSLLLAFIAAGITAHTQSNTGDSIILPQKDVAAIDTSIDYDDLFRDFDAFMDSILSPNSYFLASLSFSKNYYNFETKNSLSIVPTKKLTYSPTLGYYHRSGFGVTTTGYIVNDETNTNFYQFSISPTFDYLHNKKLATGLSFTRYVTKDSLPFYTTPLQNELYAYFTYRKTWIRPTLAVSYGWGSRSDFMKRESLIQDLRLRRRGFTYINTKESIKDFSLMTSVRHDFYWLNIFHNNDHFRFSPQFTLTSGTQKFGFNLSSSTYATTIRTNSNVLYSTENVYLDDQLKFQPLSLSLYLRCEYFIGRFFIQPMFIMDYYFPARSDNFTSLFTVNAGLMF
ncbi:MAG: hypothetical protein ACRDEB_02280 [Chitinophagaceae bacterium]